MDPIEKAKQAMGKVEKAVSGLPGIEGYREKDMRRDADKKLRETMAKRLQEQRRRLTDLQNRLLSGGGLQWVDDVERVAGRLEALVDKVRTAAYGYAGFFDLQKVKEAELDRLAAYDQALFERLGSLDEAIGKLGAAIAANAGIQEAIQAVYDVIATLSDDFGRRGEAMHASE